LGLESLYRLGDKDGLSMVRVRRTAPQPTSSHELHECARNLI
jgi:hypothetical protein